MKLTHFKTVALILAVFALLGLSGCGGSSSGNGLDAVPAPDAATSIVAADPTSVAADGTTISTVTVTVNDANSNPITDATVTLDQTGDSTISAVTNVGDGTYTFDVNSATAEIVTYTATADGVLITQTAGVTFTITEANCLLNAGTYESIVINGRTWLDRNLGASESASDVDDTVAFGNLYQWGRSSDGHELRISETNDTKADSIEPSQGSDWDGKFIVAGSNPTHYDWTISSVDSDGSERSTLWNSSVSDANLNQVCPCGYVVPTSNDFMDLNATTFVELNLPYAGERQADGVVYRAGSVGYYWTKDQASDSNPDNAAAVYIDSSTALEVRDRLRIQGYGIRCIKPLP